jgi:uncharacterized membrane protein (UPF0127 family)
VNQRKVQLAIAAALLVLVAFWLCRSSLPPSISPALQPSPSGWSPPGPQAKLPSVRLWLGPRELVAEVARASDEVATGLMFRTNMAANEGMLFLLPVPRQAQFYMRNTLLALSCAYMDDEGVILETHDMKPRDETPIPSKSQAVRFVLEVNRGWFEANQVGTGILVRTEKGALSDLLRYGN